ncbi:MAG TPA: hypothetical protein VHJ20_15750 [Polyangia bacterium]|nr:hypothetical protein [Polyangia bacterium]
MSAELFDPERWSDSKAEGESWPGAALRSVRQATEPAEAALIRAARRRETPGGQGRRARFVWRFAIVVMLLLLSTAGVVGAAVTFWRQRSDETLRAPAPSVEPALRLERPRRKSGGDVAPIDGPSAPAEEAPALREIDPPSLPHAPRPHRVLSRPVGHEAPPPEEAALVGEAFRELRSAGDPIGALRALDEYDRRFPSGALRDEARVARAEAFMAQDRRRDALALLAGVDEAGAALTRGVRITRGELLAEAGRCLEAVRDFDRVLASAADDAEGGRALYGRASCRLRAHDTMGARTDLESYLSLHADGAFAAAARRALESLP